MSDYLNKIFNLKDKIVVVTGAVGQLGTSICNSFKETGAIVIGLDLKTPNKDQDGICYMDLDIRNKKEIQHVFEKITERYKKIDILINNAGVSVFEPFEEREEDSFDWVMDVNLKGTFLCIQTFVNLFDKHKFKKGAIVNIASLYGVISPDYRIYTDCARKNSEVYGATKAGVIQMTKYFGVHLAERGIRVNAVSPGGIFNPANPQGSDFVKNYSERCPMNRMADVSDMLGGIIYLASDAAAYTTGHNIVIDGGMTSW